MGATFAKVQKLLGDRKDVHLISVSVDPTTDTPERLKAWAGKLGGGPGWTLVTGDREAVTRLLKALGVYTARLGDHSPLVLAGNDAHGTWTRAYGLAPPAKLWRSSTEWRMSGRKPPSEDQTRRSPLRRPRAGSRDARSRPRLRLPRSLRRSVVPGRALFSRDPPGQSDGQTMRLDSDVLKGAWW